jgi:predicted ATPase
VGIRDLHIRDFRGIDDLTLSFVGPKDYPTQVVVIGGPNGCGKTAVIEACLLVSGHEKLVRGKSGRDAVRLGQEDFVIEAKLQDGNAVHSVTCTSRKPGRQTVPFWYFSSWRAPQLLGTVGVTAGKRGKRPAKTEENRLWLVKQFLVNAKAHALFPSQESTSELRFSAAMREINRTWQIFFPGQSLSVEPESDDPNAGFDVYRREDHDPRLPVDALSSGQLEVLMFAGALVMEENARGVILIDEPELHLDPQWHRQILRAIVRLKPECQIVVATHSPEIYESVMSYERHFLVPADDPRARSWNRQMAVAEADE